MHFAQAENARISSWKKKPDAADRPETKKLESSSRD
jgi:hypothetical protein